MEFLGRVDVERIADSGHPHARDVAEALATVEGKPVPVQQLKVRCTGTAGDACYFRRTPGSGCSIT
ncbi:hypothetical protein JCM33774_71050 [Actinophytocola sp. KF-1]